MSGGGSRVWGAGERESAGGPARIRAAAAELGGRGGRGGSGGQEGGRIELGSRGGGGQKGGRTHAHTREDEKRARFSVWPSVFRFPFSVWVKFDLGWIGLRLGGCYFRRGKKVAND